MMLGHLMEWFFSGAGGIRQFFDFSGKSCIIISPEPVGNIEWAKTSYNSFSGKISTEWKAGPDTYTLKVVIPFGADADVLVPGEDPGRITVNGIPAISNGSVTYIEKRSGRSLFRTGSGEYTFVSPR
jgi:hypothetical protein